jgi:hypothetical protein
VSDPTIDYAHTADARVRRVAKAYKLADQIDDLGHVPDVCERVALRKRADIKSASDETWSMAIDIWRDRRQPGDNRQGEP